MKIALLVSIVLLLLALTAVSVRERNYWDALVWFGGAIIYFGLVGVYRAVHS